MTRFVQIIDFRTSRLDEVQALGDAYREARAAQGGTAVVRAVVTADRDDPGRYLNIVEFDSYEAAMENSARPETDAFAAQMAALCDGPPTFLNLDVRFTWND
ncbi:putative quinol monooxygenase [Cellulomonas sp. P5_E12]